MQAATVVSTSNLFINGSIQKEYSYDEFLEQQLKNGLPELEARCAITKQVDEGKLVRLDYAGLVKFKVNTTTQNDNKNTTTKSEFERNQQRIQNVWTPKNWIAEANYVLLRETREIEFKNIVILPNPHEPEYYLNGGRGRKRPKRKDPTFGRKKEKEQQPQQQQQQKKKSKK